jgi:hypothetical protein
MPRSLLPGASARAQRGVALLAVVLGSPALVAFTSVAAPAAQPRLNSVVSLYAEEAAASPGPAPSSSVALVKVNEENAITGAGTLAGVAGLLLGGIWIGGAFFTIASYLARKKDDDVSKALQGLATSGIEAINFVANLNDKYEVTGKIGSAIKEKLDSASAGDNKETASSVSKVLSTVTESIESFDKDVGIKDTLGSILTAGSELSAKALDKVVELDKQYKVTEQLKEKIDSSINQVKSQ